MVLRKQFLDAKTRKSSLSVTTSLISLLSFHGACGEPNRLQITRDNRIPSQLLWRMTLSNLIEGRVASVNLQGDLVNDISVEQIEHVPRDQSVCINFRGT